jgi:replicative DNA helicase
MDEQDLQGVLPPHSVEAEQAVLGAVLIDNRCLDAVQPVLRTEDFYRHEHRTIWRVATALILAGKEADIITVFAALRVEGMADDVGGLRYLNDLAQCVPSSTKAEHYAGIVRHRAVCRRLMAVGQDLMRGAGDAGGSRDDLHALIDRIMLELIALQQGTASGEPRVVADLLPGWLDALEARSQGRSDAVPTGLHDVDRLLAGGMRPGELVVIGARPSMGKSALCLAMARNVARAGPVLVCSMEDSDMMLVSRQVAAAGRVNLADIRTP